MEDNAETDWWLFLVGPGPEEGVLVGVLILEYCCMMPNKVGVRCWKIKSDKTLVACYAPTCYSPS